MRNILVLASVFTLASFPLSAQIGVNTSNPQNTFHVDGAKDNLATGTPTAGQQANDFIITASGQVAIGTVLPDPSAIFDISNQNGSIKRGFLGPKVALTSRIDQTTIAAPAIGLLVFNLGTGGLGYVGYVFWNGTEWRSINNTSTQNGTIDALTCNKASLSPSTYTSGVPYTGTMSVPYTGGNGGIYAGQTLGPVNGLTATLAGGSLNVGAGTLTYAVSGTPTVTSPSTTIFPLNIGGKTCSATVGVAEDNIVLGDLVYYKASLPATTTPAAVWLSAYASDLPVLGGKLRLDAYFSTTSSLGAGGVTMFPRLVNISPSPVKFWFSALTTVDRFNAGNYLLAPSTPTGSGTSLAPSAYVELDNGIYYNLGYDDKLGITTPRVTGFGGGAHQEVLTMDLSLDNKWYRVYYFPIVDNKNTTSTADDTREIYLSIQRLF